MMRNQLCMLALAAFMAVFVLKADRLAADEPAADRQPKKPLTRDVIRQALAKPVEVKFKETPFDEVAQDLQTKLGVPVRLDIKALKDIGISTDLPGVTFASSGVSAKAALRLMLRAHGLTWTTRCECLLITTPEEVWNDLEPRVYDVTDLICSGDVSDAQEPDFNSLMEMIKASVHPVTWDDLGGPGTIAPFGAAGSAAIVVSQTEDVCEQLESLLSDLREMRDAHARQKPSDAWQQKPTGPAAPQTPAYVVRFAPKPSAVENTVREALETPVNLQFKDAPLGDVVKQLEKTANLPITLDYKALFSAGIEPTTPVTLDASGRTLLAMLDELVGMQRLVWTFVDPDNSIVITTPEEEEAWSFTRTYDVSDLPRYRDDRGDGVPDYDAIIDMIKRSVAPKTWDEGLGTIDPFVGTAIRAIVVSQTWQTHRKIESLLASLHEHQPRMLTKADIAELPRLPGDYESKYVPPPPLEPNLQRDTLVHANNEFAFDLYKQASKGSPEQEKGNLFFSPCGISMALAMVYTGARGQTAEEMAKTLHFAMPGEEVASACKSLLATLPGANQRGCRLIVANRLWGQQGYGFADSFLTTVREQFAADLAQVDFAQPDAVCLAMNAWTKEKTAGKIAQIAEPNTIDKSQRFALTNAVYFMGHWANQFNADQTTVAPFVIEDGKIDVAMMTLHETCRYGRVDDVTILEKTYRGGRIAMMILLPENEPGAMADLQRLLSAEKVKQWSRHLSKQEVDIYLPRFKLETSLPLDALLASMGMSTVFQPDRADLSGITTGKERLWLGYALHRAFVNVDEQGTEAAAVTGLGGMGGAPQVSTFRADHPFVFLIRDTRSGAILFLGRLMKPEPASPADVSRTPKPGIGKGMM
jgi:serpin B